MLVHVLYEQVMKRDIPTYEEYFAWQLVINDDRCQGVIAWDLLNGGLKTIGAKTVILATGGAGRLYVGTTNAYACTGDGMTMALHAGVRGVVAVRRGDGITEWERWWRWGSVPAAPVAAAVGS